MIDLFGAIDTLNLDVAYDKKFLLTMNLIKQQVKPHYDAFQASNTPLPKYIEFDKKRVELAFKFCTKDASGQPVLNSRKEFDFSGDSLPKYLDSLKPLVEEYKQFIVLEQQGKAQLTALMEEIVEIELPQISWLEIPDGITKAQNDTFLVLVKESPEELQKLLTA